MSISRTVLPISWSVATQTGGRWRLKSSILSLHHCGHLTPSSLVFIVLPHLLSHSGSSLPLSSPTQPRPRAAAAAAPGLGNSWTGPCTLHIPASIPNPAKEGRGHLCHVLSAVGWRAGETTWTVFCRFPASGPLCKICLAFQSSLSDIKNNNLRGESCSSEWGWLPSDVKSVFLCMAASLQ